MTMTDSSPKRLYEFGPFTVDTQERFLLRDGIPLPVTPKVFEVLVALIENHGHVIGKEELLDRVWPDAFVEAGNLNRNISTLRTVLGDDTHEPQFIRTLPKIGYRFEAEVREIVTNDNGGANHLATNGRSTEVSTVENVLNRPKLAIAIAVAIGLGVFSLVWAFANGSLNPTSRNALNPSSTTRDPKAIQLYEKGRSLWRDRSGESLHEATLLFEQAVAIDPGFALAHAALADAYAFDGQNHRKAIDTANTAIGLDPTLGEPHATIGFVKMFWEWNFLQADEHFKQAVKLSPNYATGHQWYSINLSASWRGGAALSEMQRALELEPDSLAINADMCQLLYFARRLDEAEAQCKKTLEMDPKFLNANLHLYDIYMAKGIYDEAVDQFLSIEEMVVHYTSFPGQLDELKNAYAAGGIHAFWRKRIDMLKQLPANDYEIAKYYARLGEKDQTFEHLQKAFEARDVSCMTFLAEPLFLLCCYSDTRFGELEGSIRGK